MDQAIWGPSAWRFIHSIAMNYPRNPTLLDKQHYRLFFEYLMHVLPCPKCSYNYEKEFNNLPIDPALESREALVYWTIDLHNSVNRRLGKREYSYEEVYDIYSKLIEDQKKKRAEERKEIGKNGRNGKKGKGGVNENGRFGPLSGLINSLSFNGGNGDGEETSGMRRFLSENCLLITGAAVAVGVMWLWSGSRGGKSGARGKSGGGRGR